MPKYDFSEIRAKIYGKYKSLTRFSKALGISISALSLKLDAKHPFTAPEMEKCMKLLGLPMNQIEFYFFTHKEG